MQANSCAMFSSKNEESLTSFRYWNSYSICSFTCIIHTLHLPQFVIHKQFLNLSLAFICVLPICVFTQVSCNALFPVSVALCPNLRMGMQINPICFPFNPNFHNASLRRFLAFVFLYLYFFPCFFFIFYFCKTFRDACGRFVYILLFLFFIISFLCRCPSLQNELVRNIFRWLPHCQV